MKKQPILVLLAWVCITFCLTSTAPAAASGGGTGGPADYVPGEVLVKFRAEAREQARMRWRMNWDMDLRRHFRSIGVDHFRLSGGMPVAAAVDMLRQDPDVIYAEPNYRYYATLLPGDTHFGRQWGLDNLGQTVEGVAGESDADIDAPEAWDVTTGSDSVVVAVIDSGLDFLHPEFSGRLWTNPGEIPGNGIDDDGNGYVDDTHGWDFVNADNMPLPSDASGHGTHVAGTIAAAGDNDAGVAGVSWQATILPLRFLDALGGGDTADAILAFEYANGAGADIINCSWGGGGYSQALMDAIDASDALVVCAAGNSGADSDAAPHYPAAYPSATIISVAATGSRDELADFSNYGAVSVDVAAPGVNIFSCAPGRRTLWADDFDDGALDGWTSGGPNNDWGLTDMEAASPYYSLADSPDGDYSQRTKSWSRAPEVDLAGRLDTKLFFKVRGSSEPGYDNLYVEASPNNVDWVALPIKVSGIGILYAISGTISDWREAEVDLSPLDGLAAAYFRFTFISDWSNNYDGWYIDDVAVTASSDQYDGSEYRFLSGTSMAAPHVSGIAALVKAEYPSLSAIDIRSLIEAGVDPIPALDGRLATGGRVNAMGSLAAVSSSGTLQFSAGSYHVNETAGAATVTVTRSGGSTGEVSIVYTTADGTATAPSDYTAVSGNLTWADGDVEPKTFEVPIVDDVIWEGAHTVVLSISTIGDALLGTPSTATLTIDDDDYHPGVIQFEAADWTIDENEGTAELTVTRTGGSDGPVSVSYATADGTAAAGSDYTAATGMLTWEGGDASPKTIAILIIDDAALEPDETLNLTLSGPTNGATLGDVPTAVLTIVENEPLQPGTVQFDPTAYEVSENGGSLVITVTRSDGSDGGVSVNYRTDGGTAVPGSDYTLEGETLIWADGDDTPKYILVTIIDDGIYEGDETLNLLLETPGGGVKLGEQQSALLTIREDEVLAHGFVQFSAAEYRVDEDAGTAGIDVTRIGGSDGAVSVGFQTQNGTALDGLDYTAAAGTLFWADGETGTRTFTLPVMEDSLPEADETVLLALGNPTGGAALGSPAAAVLTIVNVQQPPANVQPNPPVLLSPANGMTGELLTPVLSTGPFVDPDGNGHAATEWLLSTSEDISDTAAQVLVRNSSTCLTTLPLPDYVLDLDTLYYWRARFRDDGNAVSAWSEAFSFRTQAVDPDDENGDGVPDIQELADPDLDLDRDGTPDMMQAEMTCAVLPDGNPVCLKADGGNGVFVEALKIIDPQTIEPEAASPQIKGPGLFAFRLNLVNADENAQVTLYFSEPITDSARWYKYDSISGWQVYSNTIVGLSVDGCPTVTLMLRDGDTGNGDSDGIRNQVIVDPGGFGVESGTGPANGAVGSQAGGGGCFINIAFRRGSGH